MQKIFFSLMLCLFLAAYPGAQPGQADAARGRTLFVDPQLGGGTSGKTCETCHEHGRDIGPDITRKTSFTVMRIPILSLPEVVNFCIEVALRGKGLDPAGRDMRDLIEYLELLGKEALQNIAPIRNESGP